MGRLEAMLNLKAKNKFIKVTISLKEANYFVKEHHRHHKPVTGHKFSLGAICSDKIVGVVIVGRPVARMRDDGKTLEITRLCTDGTFNACSFLYSAAAQAGKILGYNKIGTYTLPEEGGSSLRASGWKLVKECTRSNYSWTCPSRPRKNSHPLKAKWLWEKELNPAVYLTDLIPPWED